MVQTFEAVYENGVIRLVGDVELPERTRVYVIVPDDAVKPVAYIRSPRLMDRRQAAALVKEVVEGD